MPVLNLLKHKKVSVWGLGYLGYTAMLKLQDNGFDVLAYDLNPRQLKLYEKNNYPAQEQALAWSRTGYVPKLDFEKIKVTRSPSDLFGKDVALHIIATPENHRMKGTESVASAFAAIFSRYLKKGRPVLILFTSAFIPGHIERYFITPLKDRGFCCPRDYGVAAAFRMDWSIERFVADKDIVPVAGCCERSVSLARSFLAYLKVPFVEFDTLREAEIYANSCNAMQAMAVDFARQLAVGYPNVNMKKVSDELFKNIRFDGCDLNMGTGGAQFAFAINQLVEGSGNPGSLTLLKEFQDINISSVLDYAEYIIRQSYKSVSIMGLTYKGNQKDLTLSPALTLANYLIKNGVRVSVHDPFLNKKEFARLLKGAQSVDFPAGVFSSEVLIIASDHSLYKYVSQERFDGLKKKTRLIIDNYGIWQGLSFPKSIRYHRVGDGTLNLLK